MIPSLVEVKLCFRRTHPEDISEPSLQGITSHYTEILRHNLPEPMYIMLSCFAIFFSLFALTTRFIIHIIGIIPSLS